MALQEGEKYGGAQKTRAGAIRKAVLGPRGKILRWETVADAPQVTAQVPDAPAPASKPKRAPPVLKRAEPVADAPPPRASVDYARWGKVAAGAVGLVAIGYGLSRLAR